MASGRTAARRRTAIAAALSIGGHAILVILIAVDLHRGETESPPAPVIEFTLAPPVRAPEPERASQPPAAPPRSPRDTPEAVLPAMPGPPLPGPVAPAPAPQAAEPAQDLPTALRTGCVGRRDQDVERRIDCKLEIWSVLEKAPPRVLPGDAIPDDKQAAWDVVARQQARRRAGVRPGGNADTIGCPHGNLGAGCLEQMLIPLVGSEARK